MAEQRLEQQTGEILEEKSEDIENQFFLGEESGVKQMARDNSMKENSVNSKKLEQKYENLKNFEEVEQGMSLMETQRVRSLTRNDQNVLESRAKNKNLEIQTQNTANQTNRSQYKSSKISNPQNSVPISSNKTAQKSSNIQSKTQNLVDPVLLEQRIKEIANNIRNRVKKDSSMDRHIDESGIKKAIKIKARQQKLNPLRHSPLVLDKNSNFTINPNDFSENKLLTFQQNITIEINPKKIVRNILEKQILQKVYKELETRQKMKVKKLKLDPINHHYPITSFRKSIIQEIKSNTLRESQKEKERQLRLSKRRDIYNSSRYQRYAKIGSIFKKDFHELKQKEDHQSIILLSKLNPETQQPSVNLQKQTSPIRQIESLIQFVNNSQVKSKQDKQAKQSDYEWQQQ